MTSTFSETHVCVECSGPLDQPPRDNRFSATAGRAMLVLHVNGTSCGQWIHEDCATEIQKYGARTDDCACGAGPSVGAILPELLAGGQTGKTEDELEGDENEQKDDDDESDNDRRTNAIDDGGYEPQTERGSDEEEDDQDEDDENDG